MVTNNLRKTNDFFRKRLSAIEAPLINQQLELLKGLPFYCCKWFEGLADGKTVNLRHVTNTNIHCCFNHAIGLPQKNGQSFPLFDYEQMLYNTLQKHKHIWIKKATGLGITELILRYMTWLCFSRNIQQNNSQMCIVTGPREDLAIGLIDRMKKLFLKLGVTFDDKQTVIELNGVHIEAYPSNHLDSMRGLENVSFIFLDEADFFRIGEQQNARDVSERYIAKSNPTIVMVSTPNAPEGLFERIEKEPADSCLYHRIALDYTIGLGKIYTEEEIAQAKQSPSFEREYNLKYLGLIGNVFHTKDIEAAIKRGRKFAQNQANPYTQKSVGLDPGFGSSNFGVCITEWIDGQINILHAEEYQRPDFGAMIDTTIRLLQQYGVSKSNNSSIYVDGANPSFIRTLKRRLNERVDYEKQIEWLKTNWKKQYNLQLLRKSMLVVPVAFSTEHKQMLAHSKKALEYNGGCVAINEKHTKLITALRTAVENGEGSLDKEATSNDDLFDAFRLALQYYQ